MVIVTGLFCRQFFEEVNVSLNSLCSLSFTLVSSSGLILYVFGFLSLLRVNVGSFASVFKALKDICEAFLNSA